MNKIITHIVIMFLLLVAGGDLYAQKKTILGKVVSKSRDLEGIYIKNINTNKATLTQKGGYFSIDVHENDTLIFSAVHLIGREKVVSPADMNKSLVFRSEERRVGKECRSGWTRRDERDVVE